MKGSFKRYLKTTFVAMSVLLVSLAVAIPKGTDVLLINGAHTPILDMVFATITNFGSGLVLIALLIWSLFVQFRVSLVIATGAILHGLLVLVFKRILFAGMPRPTAVLDQALIHFVPGVQVHQMNSFPSGHTATVFLAAFLVGYLVRKKSIVVAMLLLALLVGISRIYLAQHFLMDVAAGSVIGTLCGILSLTLFDNNRNLPKWMELRFQIKLSHRKTIAAK